MMVSDIELMAYWPRMVAYARRILIEADHTDWEDAAASAMESAFRARESLERAGSVEGWLIQATRWCALNARGRRQRDAHRLESLAGIERARADVGTSAHVMAIDVRDALATLPPKLQEHAAARMSGRSLREIGEALGHTKQTAHHHDLALRKALRDRLDGIEGGAPIALRPVQRRTDRRTCAENGCDRGVLARGVCRRHYLQQWRAAALPGAREARK